MQRNQEGDRPRFVVLQFAVAEDLNLTWTQYILLDMVYHLSAKYGVCYMSKTGLAERLGVTLNAVKYQINQLIERELLVQDGHGLVCGQSYVDVAYSEKNGKTIKTAKIAQTAKTDSYRGGKLQKLQSTAKTSDKQYSNNIKINKKDLEQTFDLINSALQTKSRYSESYGKLLTKALKDFTAEELAIAAEHFRWKFHGGSTWHTDNPKFFTLKQFLSSDKDLIPRYVTCYEEAQAKQTTKPRQIYNQNPRLQEFFPS